jgi:hypothetical protein
MRIISLVLSGAVVATLAGCVATSPNVDAHFGQSLAAGRAMQTLDPQAGLRAAPPAAFDGAAAHAVMERYLKSFQTPPPPTNVFAIGVGAAGTSP